MHAYESNPSQDAAEKIEAEADRNANVTDLDSKTETLEDNEVFTSLPGQTDFRTLGW